MAQHGGTFHQGAIAREILSIMGNLIPDMPQPLNAFLVNAKHPIAQLF